MKLNEVFKPDGLLASHFPDYEMREGQVRMAKLVESALVGGYSAVIEGATGVGKSFAYLIPLILSEENAIISTSNKSLQDQLSNKDLPALQKILPTKFTWTVLKGKNNYFCHEHFSINQKEIKTEFEKLGYSTTEAKVKIQEIAQWANETEDGDLEYYPEELPESIKSLISCDTKTVHEKESVFYQMCFANKARTRAKEATIVLVNHTLLALDISLRRATDNKAGLLPESDIFIVDEAHTFEKYASMAFSDEISWYTLHHLVNWMIVKKSAGESFINSLSEEMARVLEKYLPERGDRGYFIQKKFPKFDGFDKVIELLEALVELVKNNSKLKGDDDTEAKKREITKEANNLIERLKALGTEDDNMLRWSEAREGATGKPIIKLKSVPLDISQLLKTGLFEDHRVICTSATLAVGGSFDFFMDQVGMPKTSLSLIVESPFNFQENALIYISTGELEKYKEIQDLLTFSKGRAFVLFTSYKDMADMYEMIDIPYPKFMQTNGISRVQLLEDFKNTPNAVLFATKSFWEGVDVKGDQLLLVIIHKIPFETPTDIVYASKVEKLDKKLGVGKGWSRYTIPDACLKLKQGVGRLIRSTNDIGVIALLDARVNYKSYGKAILEAFPPAYRTQKLDKIKSFYERKNR